ncbi:sesquipedalian-1 isoform X1 [Alosa alosa]|uniref:sesquipedalian-1 isoform X1 n=1 Tax=Alosa alosa TaxID=278164 RepID=UPI0020152730|nr:sesquipedalian-1 isoform X1 [Alosa alosa]
MKKKGDGGKRLKLTLLSGHATMKLNERSVAHYATCDSPPDKTGFLFKKGERNTAYHRRWFVLKGNMLFYFEERESKEPIGVIVLEGCTVELCESAEEFAFAVKFDCARARVYKMAAESQAGMESWVKALSRASFDYMRLVVRELEKQLEELQEGARGMQGKAKGTRRQQQQQQQQQQQPSPRPKSTGSSTGGALAASSTSQPQGPTAGAAVPAALALSQPEDAQPQTGHAKENGVAWSKPSALTNGVPETLGVVWDADGSSRGDGFRPPPVPPRRRGGSGSAQGSLESPFSPETGCFSKLHDWYGKEVAELRVEWLQSQ